MDQRLGDYLAAAIKRLRISREEFARRVKYSPQNLHQVIHHMRGIPIDRIPAWKIALGDAIDPELFEELALLEACPDLIRSRYLKMKDTINKNNLEA